MESSKEETALEGVKVVDFTQSIAGPLTGKTLADFGAEVVKIETHTRLDLTRTGSPFKGKPNPDSSTYFAIYNSGKYGISINLREPKGKEIALKLISWGDIVCENFSPGVMARLGLDYDSVKKIKPDIIYWSNSMMGQYGPLSKYRGFGAQAVALSGVTHISGWPDRSPAPPYGAYTDFISPYFGVAVIMAAMDYRRRTGKGVYFDQSQCEAALQLLAPPLMDYWVNGTVLERNGNRLGYAAPHGVYKCKGDERWVAIGIFSNQEWSAFKEVIGNLDWTADSKFETLTERKKNENELDRLIEQWTVNHTPEQIEILLQSAGICASVVQNGGDLFEDPQLKHREHVQYLEHSFMGRHAYDAPSARFSKTPFKMGPSPCLGEHNQYVLSELLGLSSDEIEELLLEGIITTDEDIHQSSIMF